VIDSTHYATFWETVNVARELRAWESIALLFCWTVRDNQWCKQNHQDQGQDQGQEQGQGQDPYQLTKIMTNDSNICTQNPRVF